MGKFISISYRHPSLAPNNLDEILGNLSASLFPSNFTPESDIFLKNDFTTTVLINPSPVHELHHESVCVGAMVKKTKDWYKPDGEVPDGNFALVRANDQQLQIVSDKISTRYNLVLF